MQAIVTDFSGVLVHDGFQEVVDWLERSYRIKPGTLRAPKDRLWCSSLSLGKMPERQFWTEVLSAAGVHVSDEGLRQIRQEDFSKHRIHPEMFEFFRQVEVRKGLLTNSCAEWFDHWNSELGLSDLFDLIVTSYDVGMRKPDPGIYKLVLEGLGADPRSVLFVDDQERNLEPAMQLGMRALKFSPTAATLGEMRSMLA